MQIEHIGANVVVIRTNASNVLFSYNTPVAAFVLDGNYNRERREDQYIRTKEFHSVTTSKHINQWLRSLGLDPKAVKEVEQEVLDNLNK